MGAAHSHRVAAFLLDVLFVVGFGLNSCVWYHPILVSCTKLRSWRRSFCNFLTRVPGRTIDLQSFFDSYPQASGVSGIFSGNSFLGLGANCAVKLLILKRLHSMRVPINKAGSANLQGTARRTISENIAQRAT